VEDVLGLNINSFTAAGMYQDPNVPMPYDHFPRKYMEILLLRGYNGTYRDQLEEILYRGAWSSLLFQSPWGELPTGGRSSQHQWNEAVQTVTYELHARYQQSVGNFSYARAFKRAARLAHASVRRWRTSNEDLYIVKNHFNPALRFGYQTYSFASNYNLLPASMLAESYLYADDEIQEGPSFAETGGFAFCVPEFHKVFANLNGLYVEVETNADPAYDSLGLTRIHKIGVEPLIMPTAGSPVENFGGARGVGVAWSTRSTFQMLSQFGQNGATGLTVSNYTFNLLATTATNIQFEVIYNLQNGLVSQVTEKYILSNTSVSVSSTINSVVDQLYVIYPAFSYDGQSNTTISVHNAQVQVSLGPSTQTFTVENYSNVLNYQPSNITWSRNGYLQLVQATFASQQTVSYTLTPN